MVEIHSPKPATLQGFDCDDHRIPLEALLKRYGTDGTKVLLAQII